MLGPSQFFSATVSFASLISSFLPSLRFIKIIHVWHAPVVFSWPPHRVHFREVLRNEFRYDFRKGPREISASTVFTCIIASNTVITVPAKISRGSFWKSYRNSFCKPPFYWIKPWKVSRTFFHTPFNFRWMIFKIMIFDTMREEVISMLPQGGWCRGNGNLPSS